ncbi:MAG: hypothetical protein AAFX94_18455, partial [Myxococcota bacterium]
GWGWIAAHRRRRGNAVGSAEFFSISFGCDPDRVQELSAQMKAVVDSMRTVAPSEEELQKLVAQQRRSRETAVETNGFWLQGIVAARRNEEPLNTLLEFEALIEALTAPAIQAAAKEWLSTDRKVEVVLLPEERAAMLKVR